jgi:hypothetical protein
MDRPEVPPEKRPSVTRGLAQMPCLQIAGRIKHFLHTGTATRTFVADHNDVTHLDRAAEDACHRIVLALEHARGAGK